eukprot:3931169-Pleurochrysis_carterae.AAC.1
MASFAEIKELHEKLGRKFELKQCKEALNASGGDMDKAAASLEAGADSSTVNENREGTNFNGVNEGAGVTANAAGEEARQVAAAEAAAKAAEEEAAR